MEESQTLEGLPKEREGTISARGLEGKGFRELHGMKEEGTTGGGIWGGGGDPYHLILCHT